MLKKIGPYRVEERLGVGGMGEVYKAYDDRLDRTVAIKRIRPDKEAAEDNRERFVREARATARLNHPGIVHVYDIFKDGESLCIVMEYVDGRTLDTMVMEGALEPNKVLKLGYEIATGLAEAHAKGIIHRDLKVENIIINEDGHAKILDFGLAKPILSNELDPNLTSKGQLVGTSRAMSPEYVSGEEIDQRSDLFSLGVLLYETSTGHSPFKAQNTLATLKQVMVHIQTPAVEMNPEVPLELSQLIDDLLAKDPDERLQTAQEVADELGLLLGQFSSGEITRPSSSGSAVSRRPGSYSTVTATATATAIDLLARRRWARLTFLLLVALAGAWAASNWSTRPLRVEGTGFAAPAEWGKPPAFQNRERIVVADFKNRTGEEILDTLAYAFRIGLEQSRVAQVLSQSQVAEVLRRMQRDPDTPIDEDLGLEICKREGARALITGYAAKIGARYSVDGHVIDPSTGASIFTKGITIEDQDEILVAVDEVTQAIRSHLGESLPAFEKTDPLAKVTTRDLEALISYSYGVERIPKKEYAEAQQLLTRAINRDPDFAMAHANLARVYIEYTRDYAKALTHLDRALELSDKLTAFEELFVKGWVARLRGTPEEVISTWSLMSSRFPDEAVGHRSVGMGYLFLYSDFAKAAEYFEKTVTVSDPAQVNGIRLNLGLARLALEQYEQALAQFEQIDDDRREASLARYYLALEQYEQAKEVIDQLLASPRPTDQQDGQQFLCSYFSDQGNMEAALQAAQESTVLALALNNERDALATSLASLVIASHLGQNERFQAVLKESTDYTLQALDAELKRRALQKASAGGIHREQVSVFALFGKVFARNGEREAAISIQEKLAMMIEESRLPVWIGYAGMLEGELLATDGDHEQALRIYKRALGSADFFQLHESLARSYEALGHVEAAAAEYQWMIKNRGRAFVECELGCEAVSVIDWNTAFYRLSRLYENIDPERARQFLEDYKSHWSEPAP